MKKVEEKKGCGMIGEDDAGNIFKVGNADWLGISTPEKNIVVVKNEMVIAQFNLEEKIKNGAKELIDFCVKNKITPILLSGDTQEKCNKVALQLGITQVYAAQLPEEKLKRIKEFSSKGKTIMLGDGINDAPALALADVGISLSDATSVAKETADIILLNNDLRKLIEVFQISQATHSTIRQNLFWAFAYNIFAIPLAAFGLLNPMIGALSMACSDIVVIGNSLRLRWRK